MMNYKISSRENDVPHVTITQNQYMHGQARLDSNRPEPMKFTNDRIVGGKAIPSEIQIPYPRTQNIVRIFSQPQNLDAVKKADNEFRIRNETIEKKIYLNGNNKKLN